jgi:hypothetical protein
MPSYHDTVVCLTLRAGYCILTSHHLKGSSPGFKPVNPKKNRLCEQCTNPLSNLTDSQTFWHLEKTSCNRNPADMYEYAVFQTQEVNRTALNEVIVAHAHEHMGRKDRGRLPEFAVPMRFHHYGRSQKKNDYIKLAEAVSMRCKENLRGRSEYPITNTDMVHSP